MLKDPIYGLGPRVAQLAAGVFFHEPKQVVELDRDGDKLDLGSVTVNVDRPRGTPADRSSSGLIARRRMTRTWFSPATPCSRARWGAPTCSAAAGAIC